MTHESLGTYGALKHTCDVCGKQFTPKSNNRYWCDEVCHAIINDQKYGRKHGRAWEISEKYLRSTYKSKARAMTHLYNCKSISPIEYRITKFDDYEVVSDYVVSNGGCDCPQGNKPTCRHRKMLPAFAKEGHIDDGFFYEWDTRQWRKPPLASQPSIPDASTSIHTMRRLLRP